MHRQAVAGVARQIVLGDRVRHHRALTVVQRVIAAHHSLQLGELADHAGQAICLAKVGGAVRSRALGLQALGDAPGEGAQALDAIEHVAELGVIDHLGEGRHARFQPDLAVLVIEEPGILEARPHHAFIAGDDVAGVARAHVGDDEEARQELACVVKEREILLVLPHGEDQALRRHFEEGAIEAAGIDLRVFDERRHLVQQIGVAAKAPAFADRRFLELPIDFRPPRGEAGDHLAVVLEAGHVLLRAFQLDSSLA